MTRKLKKWKIIWSDKWSELFPFISKDLDVIAKQIENVHTPEYRQLSDKTRNIMRLKNEISEPKLVMRELFVVIK